LLASAEEPVEKRLTASFHRPSHSVHVRNIYTDAKDHLAVPPSG
jgi:hypothetical protein